MKVQYEFLKHPTSILAMSEEIIRATNDYKARKLGNDELQEIVLWYATKHGDKVFSENDYNPTMKKIIGKRRIRMLDTMLEGYQLTLYDGVK